MVDFLGYTDAAVAGVRSGQFISMAIAVTCFVGAGLVLSAPAVGGVLMLAAAVAMLIVFAASVLTFPAGPERPRRAARAGVPCGFAPKRRANIGASSVLAVWRSASRL